VVIGDYLTKS